jgi:hypothetical protein
VAKSISQVLLRSVEAKRAWGELDAKTQDDFTRRIASNFSRADLRDQDRRGWARTCLECLIGVEEWSNGNEEG